MGDLPQIGLLTSYPQETVQTVVGMMKSTPIGFCNFYGQKHATTEVCALNITKTAKSFKNST